MSSSEPYTNEPRERNSDRETPLFGFTKRPGERTNVRFKLLSGP